MGYDVIVVGARCAGASVARLLSATGMRVLLVDRCRFPSDTISTHCITMLGLRQLARWGLLADVVATSAPLVRRLSLEIANEPQPEIFGAGQGTWTLAPRRTALDSLLVDAAADAGATVLQGARVSKIIADPAYGNRVVGVCESGTSFDQRGAIVVGADGRNSLVARQMGAQTEWSRPSRLGGWYAYFADMPVHTAIWAIGASTSAGSFPTNDGLACVWSMSDAKPTAGPRCDSHARFSAALRASSEQLFGNVNDAQQASRIYSFGSHPGFVRRPYGPSWALVGDAACFAHPVTAHGISDSFRGAQLLADAIYSSLCGDCAWDDAARIYAERQQSAILKLFAVTQRLAALTWNPSEAVNLIEEYRASVHVAARLEEEWWGSYEITSVPENAEV